MKVMFVAGFAPIVADPASAKLLYVEQLGLPLEGVSGDYVATEKVDGVKHLGVWPLADAAESCFGSSVWPEDLPVPQATIEFEVDDEEAAAAELEAAGHSLVHPAKTEPWGQSIARLLSGDGLLVGVTHTPWLHSDE